MVTTSTRTALFKRFDYTVILLQTADILLQAVITLLQTLGFLLLTAGSNHIITHTWIFFADCRHNIAGSNHVITDTWIFIADSRR